MIKKLPRLEINMFKISGIENNMLKNSPFLITF